MFTPNNFDLVTDKKPCLQPFERTYTDALINLLYVLLQKIVVVVFWLPNTDTKCRLPITNTKFFIKSLIIQLLQKKIII